jgi:hypothetical protein
MRKLMTKAGFIAAIAILLLFSVACKKNKDENAGELSSDFIGIWENQTTLIKIEDSKNGSYQFYSSSGNVSVSENASGSVGVKNDVLTIGSKKLQINTYPTQKEVSQGGFNTYVVLDQDILYKRPYIEDACTNGIQDNGEKGVDCGGKCEPCPTCSDGILNQDEYEIDCGGSICNACPNCEDGKQNQNETGIDCGGICEPCETNLCSTANGYGENFYNGSTAIAFTATYVTTLSQKVTISMAFTAASPCKAINIQFNSNTFTQMPVNTTQLFKTSGTNACSISFYMQTAILNPLPNGSVYVKRIDQTTFNLKFCKLKANKSNPYLNDGDFSVNLNFSVN